MIPPPPRRDRRAHRSNASRATCCASFSASSRFSVSSAAWCAPDLSAFIAKIFCFARISFAISRARAAGLFSACPTDDPLEPLERLSSSVWDDPRESESV